MFLWVCERDLALLEEFRDKEGFPSLMATLHEVIRTTFGMDEVEEIEEAPDSPEEEFIRFCGED